MPRNQLFQALVTSGAVALFPLLTAFGRGAGAGTPPDPTTVAVCTAGAAGEGLAKGKQN